MSSNQRLRMEATESEASVTPLELFFDLVFVFGLTQVTSLVRRGTGPDPSRRRERLHPRGSPTPDVIADGEVVEADPPRRLVQTWRMLMTPETTTEGFTRLTYEIAESRPGVSELTLTHELEGASRLAMFLAGEMESAGAGGGWAEVLSDLKNDPDDGAPRPALVRVRDEHPRCADQRGRRAVQGG